MNPYDYRNAIRQAVQHFWISRAGAGERQVASEDADLPAGIKVTTKGKWSEVARKRTGEDKDEATRKAISRAVTSLTVAKRIGVHSPFFWLLG